MRSLNKNNYSVIIFFCITLFTTSAYPSEIKEIDEPEEIFIVVRYTDVLNEPLTALYSENNLYLPLTGLLTLLMFDFQLQDEHLSLIYPQSGISFELDIKNNNILLDSGTIRMNKNDLFLFNKETYINKDLLAKLLKSKFTFNLNELILNIQSSQPLPVYINRLREKKQEQFSKKVLAPEGPVMFPYEKKILSGGILDYNLSYFLNQNAAPVYGYNMGGGLQLLGGDTRIQLNGSIFNKQLILDNYNYIWDYALDSRLLSNIKIGHQIINFIEPFFIEGISISNSPVEPRKLFSEFILTGSAAPHSTVELYLNEQLNDLVYADSRGEYSFSFPLLFGSNLIKTRTYSSSGMMEEKRIFYQIPSIFIPAGEVDYNLNIGRLGSTNRKIGSGKVSVGITDWLTNSIGGGFIDQLNKTEFHYYNSLDLRLSNYNINIETVPGVNHKVTLSALYPSLSSLFIQYRNLETNNYFNPLKIKNEIFSTIFFPVKITYPLNFNLSGFYSSFENSYRYDYSAEVAVNFDGVYPNIGFRESTVQNMQNRYLLFGSLMVSLPDFESISVFKGNSILSRVNYSVSDKMLENIYLSFSTVPIKDLHLQVSYIKNFIIRSDFFQLQLITELPFTRGTTNITKNAALQSLSGSILYDQTGGDVLFFNRNQTGKAGAHVRMFLDRNNNNKLDDTEEIIPDVKINMSGASTVVYKGNTIRILELLPYNVYKVRIDDKGVKNPFIRPVHNDLTFAASPNIIREIDIPFYFAGEVNGIVNAVIDNQNMQVSNAFLIIEDQSGERTKIRTFSDGSFYYFGLKPGSYKIFPDEAYLKKTNKIPQPAYHTFIIRKEVEGESILNLNFLLMEFPK